MDRPDTKTSKAPVESPAMLEKLEQEIRYRQKHDEKQSVLRRAVGLAWTAMRSEEPSIEMLTSLRAQAKDGLNSNDSATKKQTEERIAKAIDSDRAALKSRDCVADYTVNFLKTTGLFLSGKRGLAGTIGVYALDQWNPHESGKDQTIDVSLGALRGLAMKGVFHLVGNGSHLSALKGVSLGIGNSLCEKALTPGSYRTQAGQYTPGLAATSALHSALDWKARSIDGIVFLGAQTALSGCNLFAAGAIERSPALSRLFTGATFGMSAGGVGEYMRQNTTGERVDLGKIAQQSLAHGAIDMFAAGLAGKLSARHELSPAKSLAWKESSSPISERLQLTRDTEPTSSTAQAEATRETEFSCRPPEWLRPTEQALAQLGNRLKCQESEIRLDVLNEDLPQSFDNVYQFLRLGIRKVNTPARIYTVDGHTAKLVYPTEYAKRLDEVRELRIAAESSDGFAGYTPAQARRLLEGNPLKDRPLPEDIIQHLDDLPDRTLGKRYIFRDQENPEDLWNKKLHGNQFSTYSSAEPNGDIHFYRADSDNFINSPLRRAVFHEWAHIMKWQNPELSTLFDKASKLESRSSSNATRSNTDPNERWAVHMSDRLLSPDIDEFAIETYQSPVGMSLLGLALKQQIGTIAPPFQSRNHAIYQDRIRTIEQTTVKQAIQRLEELSGKGSTQTGVDAKLLLDYFRQHSMKQPNQN